MIRPQPQPAPGAPSNKRMSLPRKPEAARRVRIKTTECPVSAPHEKLFPSQPVDDIGFFRKAWYLFLLVVYGSLYFIRSVFEVIYERMKK